MWRKIDPWTISRCLECLNFFPSFLVSFCQEDVPCPALARIEVYSTYPTRLYLSNVYQHLTRHLLNLSHPSSPYILLTKSPSRALCVGYLHTQVPTYLTISRGTKHDKLIMTTHVGKKKQDLPVEDSNPVSTRETKESG